MGLNAGTFLKRTEGIVTGFGFKKNIPLSLYSFHQASDGAPLTITTTTNAAHAKKGTSSKHTVLTWVATKTGTIGIQVQVPDDYDKDNDIFILKLKVVMSGSTNTPTITAAAYKNEASGDLAPDATAALSDTIAWVDINLSGNSLVAGDNLTIDLTPGSHGTDSIDIFDTKIEYRSDLVYNDIDNR